MAEVSEFPPVEMKDPAWCWAFKTNDHRKWIVVSARPVGDRAYVADAEDVPTAVKKSPKLKVNRDVNVETTLMNMADDLAIKRKLKIGRKFHVGWVDMRRV